MNVWKKIGALTFVLIVAMALSVSAFATSTPVTLPTNDAAGAFTTADPSPITALEKTLKIYKDITAYNPNGSDVAAPTITYSYAIIAGSADKNVTDATDDHSSGSSVSLKTKAGVTTGVTMKSDTNTTAAATTTLGWTNSDTLKTAAGGSVGTVGTDANTKSIVIDFSNVVFSGTGVYRYAITETVDGSGLNRAKSGVTGSDKTLFLDVYVKSADSGYTNGTTPAEWTIYGYALFETDGDITDSSAKLTGFQGFDKYYTTNVTVSKNIERDTAMVAAAYEFPFMVKFTNSAITQNVKILATTTNAATSPDNVTGSLPLTSGGTDFDAGTFNTTPDLKIGENTTGVGSVTYTGVPVATTVDVKEKNDITGATYSAVAQNDSDTAKTAGAIAKDGVYASNQLTTGTAGIAEAAHTIAFTNTLTVISPTGVTLRYAPYFLTLGAGVVALPLTRSYRRREED